MRQAGTLDNEKHAGLFSDYLHAQGIQNETERDSQGRWMLWIYDDSRLDEGKAELERFLAAPDDPLYRQKAAKGRAAVAEKKREDERFRDQMVDVRTSWVGVHQWGIGRLTAVLIGISIMVFLFSYVGGNRQLVASLYIDWPPGPAPLGSVREGQIWRLITPIFLHFGYMHIIFNCLGMKYFGSAVEIREGTLRLALQVLVFGVLSNLGQYFVTGSPQFGGMSGVWYGLFGYVWIRGKYDPKRPYMLEQSTVVMAIGWFVLCFTGLLGPIANTAHAVGLFCGVVWATISVRRIPFTDIRF